MASKSPISTRPIDADDAAIEAALNDAHLPSLMAATVHLSGDISPLTGDIKPFYDFFGDGQGGLNDEQRARVKKQALDAIIAYRDRDHTLPPQPAQNDVRTMMNFVAGAEIPDHYIPFLRNELALEDDDPDAPEWGHTISDSTKQRFRVLIIGAGMSGILAAIRLGQAGVPHIIIDKNADVGGTWTENTYPGCRVDNPNHMYSYSFEPNHDWPQHYSTQPNLNAYFKNVAIKYGVRDQVQFNTVAETCVYDEARAIWSVTVKRGNGKTETIEANAVITAVGQLNRPNYPDIKGRDTFKGPSFHSSRWNHDVDLTGKNVAVIGTGASAFQFVPEIAPKVKHMDVFQRSAPWLGPTPDYHGDVGEGQKWLLKHMPFYAQWYRFWIFWTLTDGILDMVTAEPGWNGRKDAVSPMNDMLRDMLSQYTLSQIKNNEHLAKAAVPTYPPGGKRSVRDNGVWLAALQRDNVSVVTDPIAEITPDGVKTKDGSEHKADVLIYGTGFQASHFLEPIKFKGRGGVDLHEQWDGDARAYLGMSIPNFPNLFVTYGPNTNSVVNGSIIFFSECEVHYILGCIEMLLQNGDAAMEVKKDVHDAFNERVDAANAKMAWGVPQVSSWYKNEKGRVSQNWPFRLVEYWQATRKPNPKDFHFTKLRKMDVAAE
ncbi:MAG TPA: NAD(P)/FAD-dependent oxidoreductase [Rhizomicrobium sp.]|nr:NAD(P)/FAD-dependent oxidoreductase [Rhizomicrobium sp.]